MSIVGRNIWGKALSLGTQYAADVNQRTRVIHANRMALYSLIVMIFFAVVFVILSIELLALVMFFFITLSVLSITFSFQGNFNTSRLMYVFIANATIFTYANILGEEGGTHFLFFSLIPGVFTFFSAKEKDLLVLCVFVSPLLWTVLELGDYAYFKLIPPLSVENLSLLKFLAIASTFATMFFFLFDFLIFSYKNEELLTSSIVSLKIKERELTEKNDEFLNSTKELISIQQLLSANQVNLEKEKLNAEKALKVKTDFLSSMSHEIRTPMNVIVGLTDILIDTENDNEKLENLQLIKNSSDNLLVIINDILDFSKMDSGKLILENIDFDLYKKVKDVAKFIAIKARDNKNQLEFHIETNVPQIVSSDPVRINQVLINLLSNATKFTKNGKIELFVMVSKQISPIKSRLRFEVRDNGIGISNDSLHKIFDSFTQASSSTTRQYGGTGLGLPISKRIVELLGGEIWVESKLGEGSSFFVELPIGHKEISENIKLNSLVVEDFEMTQMLLEKTFESLDISCAFVDDYDTWQERVLAVQYSFVIIDVTKEGFEWAKIKDFILDHHLMEHTNLLIFNNEYFEEMQQMGIVVISQPINKNEIQAIKEMIVSGRNG